MIRLTVYHFIAEFQSDVEFASGKSNTRKEWIEQMIAESKKRKLEKATALEEAESQTKKLDERWKEMHHNPKSVMVEMMNKNMAKARLLGELDDDNNGPKDPYDALFAQLGLAGSDAGKKVSICLFFQSLTHFKQK